MAKDNLIKIGGELKSVAADGVVAGAEAIYDYTEGKSQATINQDLKNAIEDIDVSGQISGKADKSEMSVVAGTGANADKTTITLKSGTSATVLTQHQDVSGKQDVIEDLSTIRSNAAAGATAVQPATTLAGYGITDGYTKTEGQALENTVDNRLDGQDAAIALLNGSEVIVVTDHTQVASPNSQKIYREQGSTSYTDWMYQDGTWKEIATYNFPGIDDEPTAGSSQLVSSGGISRNIRNHLGDYIINDFDGIMCSNYNTGAIAMDNSTMFGTKVNGILIPVEAKDLKYTLQDIVPLSSSALANKVTLYSGYPSWSDATSKFIQLTSITDGSFRVWATTNAKYALINVEEEQCGNNKRILVSNPAKEEAAVKDMILSESYTITGNIVRDSNGDISSCNIRYSNSVTGSVSITRDNNGDVTSAIYIYGTDTYLLTVTRDSSGNVTATNLVKQ